MEDKSESAKRTAAKVAVTRKHLRRSDEVAKRKSRQLNADAIKDRQVSFGVHNYIYIRDQ